MLGCDDSDRDRVYNKKYMFSNMLNFVESKSIVIVKSVTCEKVWAQVLDFNYILF